MPLGKGCFSRSEGFTSRLLLTQYPLILTTLMNATFRFLPPLFFTLSIFIWAAHLPCTAQDIQQRLSAQKVRDRVVFTITGLPGSNPILKSYIDPDGVSSADLDDKVKIFSFEDDKNPIVYGVNSGNAFNLVFKNYNPLRFEVSTDLKEIDNEELKVIGGFLNLVVALFRQVSGDAIKASAEEIKASNKLLAQNEVNAEVTPSVRVVSIDWKSIKSPRLANWILWSLSEKNKSCLLVNELFSFDEFTKVEEYLFQKMTANGTQKLFQEHVKSMIETLFKANDIGALRDALQKVKKISIDLQRFQTDAESTLETMEGTVRKIDNLSPADDQCGVYAAYTKAELGRYLDEAKDSLKKRAALLYATTKLIEKMEAWERSTGLRIPISVPAAKTLKIKLTVAEREPTLSEDAIDFKKVREVSHHLLVTEWTKHVIEGSAGLFYTDIAYPLFGTGTNAKGKTIVVSAGEDHPRAMVATFLNMIRRGKLFSGGHFMYQLGVGTGTGRPVILGGAGLRFFKPTNLALTAGIAFTFKNELDGLILDESEVNGTAEIEKKTRYRFDSQPHGYIGIQYNF